MPILDKHHDAVVRALVKDGWTITHNPLRLTLEGRSFLVDIGAERLIGAEKDSRKIAVEIKTFGSPSPIADLEQAIGQFGLYEDILAEVEPDRELYLAVPVEAFESIFAERVGQIALAKRLHRVVTVAIAREEIARWIT